MINFEKTNLKKALEISKKCVELFNDKSKWCKETYARCKNGEKVEPHSSL